VEHWIVSDKCLKRMVQLGGLEPPTSGSTIRRSNQLSYNCTRLAASNGKARTRTGVLWAGHSKSKALEGPGPTKLTIH
jgi:hypothetical protein